MEVVQTLVRNCVEQHAILQQIAETSVQMIQDISTDSVIRMDVSASLITMRIVTFMMDGTTQQ
jgi:hypothetical protein